MKAAELPELPPAGPHSQRMTGTQALHCTYHDCVSAGVTQGYGKASRILALAVMRPHRPHPVQMGVLLHQVRQSAGY